MTTVTTNDRGLQSSTDFRLGIFSARCNIYISHLCYDVSVRLSVRLSVTEVHWRIIANLGFKFCDRTLPRIATAVLLAGGSSRAMLASARVSCYLLRRVFRGMWQSISIASRMAALTFLEQIPEAARVMLDYLEHRCSLQSR